MASHLVVLMVCQLVAVTAMHWVAQMAAHLVVLLVVNKADGKVYHLVVEMVDNSALR